MGGVRGCRNITALEYTASIWDPHLVKDCDLLEKLQRRSARFVKGITGHPVCLRCCMILAGVTLKTAGGILDWLCSTKLSLGMWPLIQIRLVWWLRTIGLEQITDANSGQLGCATHLLSEQSVIGTSCCCCCRAGESSCLQSSVGQICACRMS